MQEDLLGADDEQLAEGELSPNEIPEEALEEEDIFGFGFGCDEA